MENKNTFKVFYDGDCPLCKREIAWLEKRTEPGTVIFDDITSQETTYPKHGLEYETVMARIHGVDEEGEVVHGLDVIRELYNKAGLGWITKISQIPVIKQLCDLGYVIFARLRPYLPGRGAACEGSSCRR